jgi:predicted RNA binding protein YcfA (HicA-like mRNA interferase family)
MPSFPSLKAKRMLWILMSEPLGYRIVRQRGSHRILEAAGRRRIIFAFHDRQTLPPGVVRRLLVREAGLDEDAALDLL